MSDDSRAGQAAESAEKAPKANVPQESVQDERHFGRENELPRQDKSEYWSQTSDEGARLPEPAEDRVDPETAQDAPAPREDESGGGSNTYGSMKDGLPSSGATVDPDRKAGKLK